MQLPDKLQEAIESEIESKGLKALIQAREELSAQYKLNSGRSVIASDIQRAAYVIARLPATYAAVCKVLQAIREQAPEMKIRSVLDLGAGPGTAMWAAVDLFPEIESITLLEKDVALAQLGQRLAMKGDHPAIRSAAWQQGDLEQIDAFPKHDLIIFSYSINELDPQKVPKLIEAGWNASEQVFVIVEPGTPAGFERIRAIRSQLITIGAHLIAPCPHQEACPMAGGDWCHFPARVERSSFHRKLKGGSLGYEDEKYSYVAATQKSYPLPQYRILRQPIQRSGHTILTVCTPGKVEQLTISKRAPEAYKRARKVEWGESIDIS
jgi:ribosomal protein RSM22 (predicted rRNA methylase)